jgi:putative nucleotidyltransferase with HDIG domain
MGLDPTVHEQQRLAQSLERRAHAFTAAEGRAVALLTLGFLAVVAALLVLAPPSAEGWEAVPAATCFVALVVALRVEFDIGSGLTTPSQLAFVPLLLAVPPSLAPVAVVAALLLAALPEVVRGELRPVRLLRLPANAWFALGPAAVLAAAQPLTAQEAPLVLAGALAAQLACDAGASALREALLHGMPLREQLREGWIYVVDLALTPIGLLVVWSAGAVPWSALALLPLLGVLAAFARERRARVEGLLELNTAYRGTALVLGDVVEADDGYTGEHSRGVVALALDVGRRLGLGADRLRNLEFAALLHDVGKVAIPKEIINKPGKLDPEEWRVIRTHTVEGQRMLDQVGGFMSEVGRIVRSHHERWDGGGYPDGLAGEAIPLEARIVSCCDTWNAMTTTRSYRPALPFEVAQRELEDASGTQLDPAVVRAVLAAVRAEHEERGGAGTVPADLPRAA